MSRFFLFFDLWDYVQSGTGTIRSFKNKSEFVNQIWIAEENLKKKCEFSLLVYGGM